MYESDLRAIRERFAAVAADAAAKAYATDTQASGVNTSATRRSEFIASAVTEISATQALRITDYLASSLIEQRGARVAIEQMVRLMGGVAGAPVPRLVVPPLPSEAWSGPSRAAGGLQIIVNFNGPITGMTPHEASDQFLQQVAPALDAFIARSAGIEAKSMGRQLL